jgi:hypothetical protein
VQYNEVALLRLEGGLLRFVFPEHLRTTGAIPLSSKAVAAHTALSTPASSKPSRPTGAIRTNPPHPHPFRSLCRFLSWARIPWWWA